MRSIRLAALLLTLTAAPTIRAADPPKLSKELAVVPNDALAFFSVNLTTFWDHAATKGLLDGAAKLPQAVEATKVFGLKLEEVERITTVLMPPTDGNRRLPEPETVLILTAKKPVDQGRIIKALQLYGIEEAKELEAKYKPGDKAPPPSGKTGATFYVNLQSHVMAFVGDRTLVFREPGRLTPKASAVANPLEQLKPAAETGPLSDGLALGMEHPIAFGMNMLALKSLFAAGNDSPPDDLMPLFRADTLFGFAKLKKESADVTMTVAFAGKQWAADGEDAAAKLKQLGVFLLKEQGDRTIKREGRDSALGSFALALGDAVDKVAVKRTDNTVTLTGAFDLGPKMQAILAALPKATSESALVAKSANNLKQIGLAYHTYADANGGFGVANSYTADGKPLLSWRVHLLPYLEHDELYKQFKLNEPWDSEHNKKLIEKMPPVFTLPGVQPKSGGMTFYQSFIAEKAPAGGRPVHVAGETKGVRLPASFTDGTSNSFLCVEAADPVVWTKPADLPFDPAGKVPKLGGHFVKDRFQVVFCDGSTRLMNAALPEATLKAYITINGGEVVTDD